MLEHALTSLSWDILSTISARHVQRWGKYLKIDLAESNLNGLDDDLMTCAFVIITCGWND